MAITIKEFMDYMDNSTETKCKIFEKETNQLLFSGSMWEIPEHYKQRKCYFTFPIDFEVLTFLVEPFDTTGMMEVICMVPRKYDGTKKDEHYYFDRKTIYIDGDGDTYGYLYAKNGKIVGNAKLSRFMTIGM